MRHVELRKKIRVRESSKCKVLEVEHVHNKESSINRVSELGEEKEGMKLGTWGTKEV